jgi:hypothetical protein
MIIVHVSCDNGCGPNLPGPSGCDQTCESTLVDDDCGVCGGDGSTCVGSISLGSFDSSGSVEVLYDFGGGVAAFSFEIDGLALTGASGGASSGMMMSVSGSKVVAFNMMNTEIPAGSGVLTNVSFSDVTAASSSLYLAFDDGFYGADEEALTVTVSGSAVDHGTPDCSGDYYGTLVDIGCGCDNPAALTYYADTDGDGLGSGTGTDYCLADVPAGVVLNADDTEPDCATNDTDDCNVCAGGNADNLGCGCFEDAALAGHDCAGVCTDDSVCGVAELSFGAVTPNSVEVFYTSNFDVGGFQFALSGATLESVSGGPSGWTLSPGGQTVVGWSLGGSLPSASTPVKLADLGFTPDLAGGTLSLTDVVVSSTSATTLTSTAGSSVAFGACPADCNYDCYGTLVDDECDVCGGEVVIR